MASEQTVEQTKKINELIAEELNIDELLKFDFNTETINEMLKNCSSREQNSVLKQFKTLKEHFESQYTQLILKFQELKFNSEIEKLSSKGKGKKEKKAKSSDEEGAEKKPSAVTKQQPCCDFTTTYMSSEMFKDSNPEIFKDSTEYSRNDIHAGMREFVNLERKNNPDKITPKQDEDEKPNNKMFHVYGELETLLKHASKNIKEDISIVEKSLKEKEKESPDEGTKAFKEIEYMKQWIEDKKNLSKVPKTLEFKDFMRYSPYCFPDRKPLEKAVKKP
jgi:hypothetical protein